MKNEWKWKFPLYTWFVLDYATLFWLLHYTSIHELTWVQSAMALFLASTLAQGSINVSHECMHKKDKVSVFLGWAMLLKCWYMHFVIEHTQGHHKRVATPEDPASAAMNDNIYTFIPKSFIKGYISSWGIESTRLQRNKLPWYQNRILQCTLLYPIFLAFIWNFWGFKGCAWALASGFGGVALLETINYIEHYGLRRQKLESGEYEQVDIRHSWNAPYTLTNYLFFKLQRHSDHHENGHKEYQTLCTYDKSPMLPASYVVCTFAAFCPPLWYRIMNPIVEAYNNKTKPKSLETAQNVLVGTVIIQVIVFTALRYAAAF